MKVIDCKSALDWAPHYHEIRKSIGAGASKPSHADHFDSGWTVASESGKLLATCVLYDNPALRHEGLAAACFGHFEALPDRAAVARLIEAIAEKSRQMGKSLLIGPMNGSTWEEYRLAVDNPNFTYLFDLNHPAYYPDLLQSAGMEVLAGYTTNIDQQLSFDAHRLARAEQLLAPLQLSYRNIRLAHLEEELAAVYRFCMSAFAQNLLFTPVSAPHFLSKYLTVRALIQPEYVLLAEDPAGELCGVLFAIPNYQDPNRKGIVLKTLAKRPGKRYAGLATKLGAMFYDKIRTEGFEYVVHAFMEDNNASNNVSAYFSGTPAKHYQLFFLKL